MKNSRKIIDLWWEDDNLFFEFEDGEIICLKNAYIESAHWDIEGDGIEIEEVECSYENPTIFFPNKQES